MNNIEKFNYPLGSIKLIIIRAHCISVQYKNIIWKANQTAPVFTVQCSAFNIDSVRSPTSHHVYLHSNQILYLHRMSSVTFAVVSVFGKLLARHVIILYKWVRDKFFITILFFRTPYAVSIVMPSICFPLNSQVIFGCGEPPRTSQYNVKLLPSSYGPAMAWIIW